MYARDVNAAERDEGKCPDDGTRYREEARPNGEQDPHESARQDEAAKLREGERPNDGAKYREEARPNSEPDPHESARQDEVTKLREGERLDDLQVRGYRIIQHPGRFCFGMDAVLLANFARVKAGERAADLGTGTGVIPILLTAKTRGRDFVGLEIEKESADMARRSVIFNHLQASIRIVTGDIKRASDILGAGAFDVITVNPPYMIGSHGIRSANARIAVARHEILCTLDDVLRESAACLKTKGRFYMVHRPFRLAEILSKMISYGIEPKRMRLVHPFIDREPNMVLIEGVRGGNSRMRVEPPLIVYKAPGVYQDELLTEYGLK